MLDPQSLCCFFSSHTLELRRERHLPFVFAEESSAAVSYVIQRYPLRTVAAVSASPFSPSAQRASRHAHLGLCAVECLSTPMRAPCFYVEFLLLRTFTTYYFTNIRLAWYLKSALRRISLSVRHQVAGDFTSELGVAVRTRAVFRTLGQNLTMHSVRAWDKVECAFLLRTEPPAWQSKP